MRFYKPHNYQNPSFIITLDGYDYEIKFATHESNQLYAECMIHDPVSDNVIYVHNRIELNGHVFYFVWNEKYDWNRNNYIPEDDITVYVDETPCVDVQSMYNQLAGNKQNISLTIS